MTAASPVRREYLLRGVVQGVGFRPHVAVVAARHDITGWCGNDDLQVFIEAQGRPGVLDAFLADLLDTLPPLAQVIAVTSGELSLRDDEVGFRIVPSRHLDGARTLIPPDVATCEDCLADMADPGDRRFGYAFTTCTNCGPRLSIIEDLPYDRPATTMRHFPMCPACEREYTDPSDRRYHAQPISCDDCGPSLWLTRGDDGSVERPAGWGAPDRRAAPRVQAATIAEARRRLRAGEILAVKGLGGFHLLCDARNPAAVGRLRERKRRSGKPFAVMVADTTAAASLADLSAPQLAVLSSPARPILIAPKAAGYDLADAVAPDSDDVGLMLPYTGLHHLLVAGRHPAASGAEADAGLGPAGSARTAEIQPSADQPLVLVATSGNLSEEPLCHTNADALQRLAGLADSFLLHDRGIHVPVEDSVLLARPDSTAVPLRRSRGYAPLPLVLPDTSDAAGGPVVLAVGGELKNTFALADEDLAFVSAHVGDMGSLASQQAFEDSVRQLVGIRRNEPQIVVCDLHPGYATTAWAERYVDAHPGVRLVRVQHHYAHALSLLAEHQIGTGPVVIAALDGTGYGDDAGHPGPGATAGTGARPTIWGGEILTLGIGADRSPAHWERSWHLPGFGLVGGDRAVRHPWRVAQGLASAWELDIADTPAATAAPASERRLVASQLASGQGVVTTSSTGRLFDAASALLGLCLSTTYEAQAAMLLERAAASWARDLGATPQQWASPPLRALAVGHGARNRRLASTAAPHPIWRDDRGLSDPREVFVELLAHPDRSIPERAWRFHIGLAAVFAEQLARAAAAAGTSTVGLTGGVAVNRIFSAALITDLAQRGLQVLTHHVVPPNDGGLSLGQAWAGRLAEA